MPGTPVACRPVIAQVPLALVTALLCGLSFWLTVRFCGELSPNQGRLELLTAGFGWEVAKVLFGTYGMHTLTKGTGWQRLQSAGLVLVAFGLAAGSIAASFGFLLQTDKATRATALASSHAYQRAENAIASVDREISILTKSASKDVDQRFRARGHVSLSRVDALREERRLIEASLGGLEAQGNLGDSNFFGQIGAVFPGSGRNNAAKLRLIAQAVLAVALEVISLIALSMLQAPIFFERSGSQGLRSRLGLLRMGSSHPHDASEMHGRAAFQNAQQMRHGNTGGASNFENDAGAWRAACIENDARSRGAFRIENDAPAADTGCIESDAGALGASRLKINEGASGSPAKRRRMGVRRGRGDTGVADLHKNTRYHRAKTLIRSKGLPPSYRALQRALEISQSTAQRFLRAMVEEGVLQRRGRIYARA